MAKVVYNACFGGFGLSARGLKRYAELKGRECYFFIYGRKREGGLDINARVPVSVERADTELWWHAYDIPNPHEVLPSQENWSEMTPEERVRSNEEYDKHLLNVGDIPRTDPHLIQVIEELGDAASDEHSVLQIRDVPAGTKYRIDEYDGNESVMTIDDYKWKTA